MSSHAYPAGNRAYLVTDTDHGALLVIAATLLMSWTVLCWATRVYTRVVINGPLGLDDATLTVASILAVGQTITVMVGVSLGFGKSAEGLAPFAIKEPSKVCQYQQPLAKCVYPRVLTRIRPEQAGYASDILFLASHGLAKVSVILLLTRLTRTKNYLFICFGLIGATAAWGVGAILAIALRCDMVHPWLSDRCGHMLLRWQLITAFDGIQEAAMLTMAIYLVWSLHMARDRKVAVVIAFGFRVPVIIAAIVRLQYVAIQLRSENPTFDGIPAGICTQVLMNYSLIAATIPCLKPFVISFNTGWGQGSQGKGSSYVLESFGQQKGGNSEAPRSGNLTSHTKHSQTGNEMSLRPDPHEHNWTIAHEDNEARSTRAVDANGSVASKESQQMFIRQTAAWSVHYESDEPVTLPSSKDIGLAG